MAYVGKSNYFEALLLNFLFKKTGSPWTAPKLYLALCTVAPTDASTGATITEASYTGYAREEILAGSMNTATGGDPTASTNSAQVVFDYTSGSSTIVAWAICDNLGVGTGNMYYWGLVSPNKLIDTNNQPPTVSVGALRIEED